ncbi:MAG: tetratricopeptide repeat protein, partial [Patescibacteria group bacterium]
MKYRHIWISISVVLVFGFLFAQDSIARVLWLKYQMPGLSLVLISNDSDLAMRLGNYYFNGGEYAPKKARKAYEKALRADPDPLWANYQLARIYFVEGDNTKALEYINKELEFYPENLRSLYVR